MNTSSLSLSANHLHTRHSLLSLLLSSVILSFLIANSVVAYTLSPSSSSSLPSSSLPPSHRFPKLGSLSTARKHCLLHPCFVYNRKNLSSRCLPLFLLLGGRSCLYFDINEIVFHLKSFKFLRLCRINSLICAQ